MKVFFRNIFFRNLVLSSFFDDLGSTIYNLVFVVFAASIANSKLAVGVASFIQYIPTICALFIAMQADKTKNKKLWLLLLGYIQAILFIMVAFLSKESSWLVFSIVCFINILSDCIAEYRRGLVLPMFQSHIPEEELMEAYSFDQVISQITLISGQTLGVWLLTISHNNFFFLATINAISFLLSSMVLLKIQRQLTHPEVNYSPENGFISQIKNLYKNSKSIFKYQEKVRFGLMIFSILGLNSLGSAILIMYNLKFTEITPFGLSFAQSVFLLQTILFVSALIGGMTPNDYFSKLSLIKILQIDSGLLILIGICGWINGLEIISFSVLAFMMYLSSKVNPKLNSLLMAKLPPEILAQTSSFFKVISVLSMPLATILFTSLSIWNFQFAWGAFILLSIVVFVLSLFSNKSVTSD